MEVTFLPQDQWCNRIFWCLGQGVCISFLKCILEFLVLGRNFIWTWLTIWWEKSINQECISFHGNLHEGFGFNKQRLGAPSRAFFYFKFYMLLMRVSHSKALWYGFQSEDSLYANPHVDYVEQTKIIQWWQDFLEMKWHWKQPCWCGNR